MFPHTKKKKKKKKEEKKRKKDSVWDHNEKRGRGTQTERGREEEREREYICVYLPPTSKTGLREYIGMFIQFINITRAGLA